MFFCSAQQTRESYVTGTEKSCSPPVCNHNVIPFWQSIILLMRLSDDLTISFPSVARHVSQVVLVLLSAMMYVYRPASFFPFENANNCNFQLTNQSLFKTALSFSLKVSLVNLKQTAGITFHSFASKFEKRCLVQLKSRLS